MFYFKLDSFYLTICLLISICFFYILIFYTFIPLVKNGKVKKNLINYLKTNNHQYVIKKKVSIEYDYSIEVDGVEYFIKMVDVNKNCDIQVSTNKTLVVLYKSITNTLKSKEITDVKEFIESKNKNKILLLNAKVNSIKLSKNEHEISELNRNDKINNTLIIDDRNINLITKK